MTVFMADLCPQCFDYLRKIPVHQLTFSQYYTVI